jgi:hypothetical protein
MSWLTSTIETAVPVAVRCAPTTNVASAAALALALSTSGIPVEAIRKFEDTAKPVAVEPAAPYVVAKHGRADIKAVAKIRALGTREDGWKGPGSLAASQKAVDDAEAFARQLFGFPDMEMPNIGLAADGEINFYWKNGDIALDLGFFGDGTYSYFAEGSDGQSYSGDNILVDEKLPDVLLNRLKKAL